MVTMMVNQYKDIKPLQQNRITFSSCDFHVVSNLVSFVNSLEPIKFGFIAKFNGCSNWRPVTLLLLCYLCLHLKFTENKSKN